MRSELLRELFARRRGRTTRSLDRVRCVLAELGLPHSGWRLQVGGTNGKGSTCAMVEAMAGASGVRTGVFTSPHLYEFRERFRIDGEPVEQERIEEALSLLWQSMDELSFFECATVLAAWLFAQEDVELAIYEVGLGGRLDATTAMAAQVAVVTNIGLDHQEWLGDTEELIAREKAAILERARCAVVGPGPYQDQLAAHAGGAVHLVGGRDCQSLPELRMAGSHQRANAACALRSFQCTAELAQWPVEEAVLLGALGQVAVPGRLETFGKRPLYILDSAHNTLGSQALSGALEELGLRVSHAVIGVSCDKDAAALVGPLAGQVGQWHACASQHPRAMPAEQLRARLEGAGLECQAHSDAAAAIHTASHGAQGCVLVLGSLFLVAELRRLLKPL